MKPFFYNLVLAFLWALLTGEISLGNLFAGFVLGYVILGLLFGAREKSSYFLKVGQVIRFVVLFLKEMVVSSARVAYDVITPTYYMRPGVVAIPLDAKTDAEIALLANVITLTPGTLSLDVSEDRRTLYIHAMFVHDPDALRREIKEGLEKQLLEVMR
ncbi:MAG TPA: Na+/H+ antiporter subunit E [Kiritimatiellia bacterium]|nr:Na+/H+ antiporter subunit E [Kiritimatiellia bacterium]HMO99259.1 Na+/H+ antiporter subunit E [Kiritimatiellia bacterium]HMP96949.1 Na+/H+ antiporter subunit E [Kiritimatiellia bacterium]